MKDTGILFTPPNITAILENRKTQTRRIVKPQPPEGSTIWQTDGIGDVWEVRRCDPWHSIKCPYGTVGDGLYVKEGLSRGPNGIVCWRRDGLAVYPFQDWQWQRDTLSPLHMPKWGARLWLEITDVRLERVQEITAEDCQSEGIDCDCLDGGFDDGVAFGNFIKLWESIHGEGSWNKNPWVFVLSYKTVQP